MNERMLLVDDEVDSINFISPYLANENFEVFSFTSADKAMKCVNSEK